MLSISFTKIKWLNNDREVKAHFKHIGEDGSSVWERIFGAQKRESQESGGTKTAKIHFK